MTLDARPRPPITVTVSTVQGWPTIRKDLLTVMESVRRAGGELVVTDGSGHPPPPADALDPVVVWSSFPGESVLQLRGRAYAQARGEVVAITEDHCAVPPDWAGLHVEAHRRYPDAVAIGGGVLNGATDAIIDWAGFLAVQAPIVAPIKSGPAKRIAGALNVSYKRAALEGIDDYDGLGVMDTWHQKRLAAGDAPLRAIDDIRVHHIQPLGFKRMSQIHFDAGRTFAALKRKRPGPIDLVWFFGAPFLPIVRWLRVVRHIAPKGYLGILARSSPAIVWLFYCQAVGHLAGYALGPGDSPSRLQ